MARVQVEQLACCEPAGVGLHLTHWSTRSLAAAAVSLGKVPQIAHSTVSLILRQADLQPHRYRYWKTPTLDEAFVRRAGPILWCYEQIDQLTQREEVVVCWDEKPNVQALERDPRRRMRGWCLEKNDSEHLCPALGQLLARFKQQARKIHLIWDGGPSHISERTHQCLRAYRGWVRVLLTPAHASWLNQGELLLRAFAARYLHRGSWSSRQQLIDHLRASAAEYDQLFSHPFTWSWTRRDMRTWMDREGSGLH